MQNVIVRYLTAHPDRAGTSSIPTTSSKSSGTTMEEDVVAQCQLCEGSDNRAANVFCEQCDIFYCTPCQTALHPARGPLAKHNLVPAGGGRRRPLTEGPKDKDQLRCATHPTEGLTMYCIACKVPVCSRCLQVCQYVSYYVFTNEWCKRRFDVSHLSTVPQYYLRDRSDKRRNIGASFAPLVREHIIG
uniref:B box-type domain-containing protein n=1 Tax=Caenorhabditis japonica TaxID=281687 RepID=A0A8R1ETM9_CAEJA